MNELKPEDVMKEFECCFTGIFDIDRVNCLMMMPRAIDLLKKYQAENAEKDAEIERLNQEIELRYNNILYLVGKIANARNDTITEFADKLLRETECMGECTIDNPLAETVSVVREEIILSVANEMKEEHK